MTTQKYNTVSGNHLDDGTLGAVDAVSDFVELRGDFLVELSGTFAGTVALQVCRGADNVGAEENWTTVPTDAAGTASAWTAPTNIRGHENLSNMFYRLKCTAYTSGTVEYKLGGS